MVCEEWEGEGGLAFALHTHMGCHTIISLSLVLVRSEHFLTGQAGIHLSHRLIFQSLISMEKLWKHEVIREKVSNFSVLYSCILKHFLTTLTQLSLLLHCRVSQFQFRILGILSSPSVAHGSHVEGIRIAQPHLMNGVIINIIASQRMNQQGQ